ncbi:MAG: acyl-CoA thioesterase/bile acid-CoA:amino acid N-acyltransferase family protein [Candidatus Dormibacteria bacterium]
MKRPKLRVVAGLVGTLSLIVVALVVYGKINGSVSPSVVIKVHPAVSRLDQPISIRITHLPPNQLVSVNLTSTDANGVRWASTARFESGSRGDISLATARSLGGSYAGVQPMGMVSSMKPVDAEPADYFWTVLSPQSFRLTVQVGSKTMGSSVFRRRGGAVGVTVKSETLSAQGFVGQFWLPPRGSDRGPAILEFGGSEGGLDGQLLGADLASAGYPTLDIAYFGEAGLPQTLSGIPLQYFAGALDWLSRQPGVDRHDTYVLGISRGSEAALLLGVHYPDLVHGVIASVPSDAALCSYPGCSGPAWTLDGKPLPYTTQFDDPYPTDNSAAVIPVEQIHGPIFLDCGGADSVWTSCAYADAIMSRLAAHHDPYQHVLYAYPDAGHGVGSIVPYEPDQLSPGCSDLAGSFPSANHIVDAQLWPHLLSFLANSASPP